MKKQLSFVLFILIAASTSHASDEIRFGRDVLPILSAHCYACHGPDEKHRQADLRLDVENEAKKSGREHETIVPGKAEDSELYRRLISDDADQIMPPPHTNKPLSAKQIAILLKWIEEGAPWGKHWSFEPLRNPPAPNGANGAQAIDAFVKDKVREAGLTPAPLAEPEIQIRRLALDLTGLPPTPELVSRFVKDPSKATYDQIVDELLNSPRFGEHWAKMWLDLARYADTKGYEKDLGRTMWPYRDWVIRAFNQDMPLDEFTRKQLAGDLLPNAIQEDIIATAFHRNTMSNDEGGTDDEEFRTVAVKDRIDTTMQVWMGLTFGCAKCHSHKYDPISHQEYYQFFAIFNQTEDADRYDDEPTLSLVDEQRAKDRAALVEEIANKSRRLSEVEIEAAQLPPEENSTWIWPVRQAATASEGVTFQELGDRSLLVGGSHPERDIYKIELELPTGTYTAIRLEALTSKLPDGRLGVGRAASDPNFVISNYAIWKSSVAGEFEATKLSKARADFEQGGWPATGAIDDRPETGWAISPKQLERHAIIVEPESPLVIEPGTKLRLELSQQYGGGLTLARFRISASSLDPTQLQPNVEPPQIAEARQAVADANSKLTAFDGATPKLPIMRALAADKQRQTKIHVRGNFLEPGDLVEAKLPTAFSSTDPATKPTRLDVANWLVSADNPLTARVWANRIWARLFGAGLVETEEDFGALGSAPTHPELLDWLAAYYRDQHWSLKKLLKVIVSSDTYRQSSVIKSEDRAKDPRNQFLARSARFRLSAEVIRDQALAVGGLLSDRMYGPPVMPPQPAGLWRSTYNGQKWVDAEDENRWRRGLYTYLKRTTPYPSLITFDGGSREVCQIRRISTNTPLQALVTLNDPVYLEAAGGLAKRMIAIEGDDTQRINAGLQFALVRTARDGESKPLVQLLNDLEQSFSSKPTEASEFIRASRATTPAGMSEARFAAWIAVASSILNLDEFLTRN